MRGIGNNNGSAYTNRYSTSSASITLPYTATSDRELLTVSVATSAQEYSGVAVKINGIVRYGVGVVSANTLVSLQQSFQLQKGDVVEEVLNGHGENVTYTIHHPI